jgi:hypothetical protein
MKKYMISLSFLLLGFFGSAQSGYPKFDTDSSGQQVVIMTLEQAQALDNSTDLLEMFEQLNSQIGSYDSVCLKVVNEKEIVISTQTVQINTLKQDLLTKDNKIANLKDQIKENETSIGNLKEKIKNKDEEIGLHKKEIGRSKRNYAIGGGVVGIIAGLILGIIIAK